ncbi:hypothetical protein GCM10025770_19360 [Viridibacterium curvum]|uniref:Transposase n=1 Tax=Viridibacterium curvum TaxID=1101404 RepID=A0ABP9QNH4_9RHOO
MGCSMEGVNKPGINKAGAPVVRALLRNMAMQRASAQRARPHEAAWFVSQRVWRANQLGAAAVSSIPL